MRERGNSDVLDMHKAAAVTPMQVSGIDWKALRAPNNNLMEHIPVKHVDCSEHSHPVSKHASDSMMLQDGLKGFQDHKSAKARVI